MTEKRLSVRLAAVGGDQLKAALMEIGRDGEQAFRRLSQGAEPASRDLSRTTVEAGRVAENLDRLAVEATRMSERLRAAGATTQSVMAQINRATGVSTGWARDAADVQAYGRALDDIRAKANPAFAVIRRYRMEVEELRQAQRVGAISTDEMTEAIQRQRRAALDNLAVIRGRTGEIEQMARASRMGTYRIQNLSYQLNDIGVSLAGGMALSVVLAQQGTQIAQIYGGNGGVRQLLADVGKMAAYVATKLGPVVAATAALGVAFKGMQMEINRTSETVVSFGDVALATWQVVRDGLLRIVQPALSSIGSWMAEGWGYLVQSFKGTFNLLINTVRATVVIVRGVWRGMVDGVILDAQVLSVALQSHWLTIQSGFFSMVAALQTRWGEFVSDIAGGMAQIPGMEGAATQLGNYAFDQMARASARESTAARLGSRADELLAQATAMREAAWSIVTDSVTDALARAAEIVGEDPMGELFQAIKVRAIENALNRAAEAADGAGAASSEAAEVAAEGWARAAEAVKEYALEAMDLAGNLGDGIVNAFRSAESALDTFVREGRFSIRSFVTDIIADFAKIGARRFIFGPIANALSGWMGGLTGGANLFAGVAHAGGMIGRDALPRRAVPAAVFAEAPRFHGGGWPGLRPDEVPIIAQRGERVLSREEARYGTGDVHVHINGVRDMESFRQSRAQIAADLGRAVASSRRSM